MRNWFAALPIVAGMILASCDKKTTGGPSPLSAPAASAEELIIPSAEINGQGFRECEEFEAETVLLLTTTITGVMTEKETEYPLKKIVSELGADGSLSTQYSFRGHDVFADGVSENGIGIGYSGGTDVEQADDIKLHLHVHYRWDIEADRGTIDHMVVVSINEPFEVKLSERATLVGRFRMADPTTQPADPRAH